MPHRVIFLPGITGDPELWRPVGDRLPVGWDKVYLGWSGLGTYQDETQLHSVDDTVALVERHMLDESVDLVAQSMGGVIALLAAIRHPAKVRRLVLAATSGGLDVRHFGASDWRPEYRASFPHAPEWIYAEWPNVSEHLAGLTQPTLLLWSDSDPISPLAVGKHLNSVIPHSTLHVVKGGNHRFVQGKIDEVRLAIEKHLS